MIEVTEEEWMFQVGHFIMWARMGQYDGLYYVSTGKPMVRLKLTVPKKPILRKHTHRYFRLTDEEVQSMILPRII